MADVMSMEDIRATSARLNVELSSLDLDSIRLPPGEDFGIFSDDEDLKEEEPLEFIEGFDNMIVVDNLPVVPKEKFEKLEGVIRNIHSKIKVIKEDGLWMPVDPDTHKTLGYCFVEYNTPQAAATEGDQASVVTYYVLKVLGLDVCADTFVGDEMIRGISGGQKKRVFVYAPSWL